MVMDSRVRVREIYGFRLKTMDIVGKTGANFQPKRKEKKVMCRKRALFLLSLLSVMVVLFLSLRTGEVQAQVKISDPGD